MSYFTSLMRPAIVCLLFCACAPVALSQQPDQKRPEEQSTMRSDIESLKQTQQQILLELKQIRKLLEERQQATTDAAAAEHPTLELNGEPFRGEKSARLAIVEYSDFQCPYCAEYIRETFPLINDKYIKTGRIKYFFRDLPLSNHANALPAARAARCAGEQGRFWEMHDRLFASQSALAPSDLSKYAESLGLDKARFNQCLASDKYSDAINRSAAAAEKMGIDGTPAFLIGVLGTNGEQLKVAKIVVGAEPFESFKAALDDLLSSQGK